LCLSRSMFVSVSASVCLCLFSVWCVRCLVLVSVWSLSGLWSLAGFCLVPSVWSLSGLCLVPVWSLPESLRSVWSMSGRCLCLASVWSPSGLCLASVCCSLSVPADLRVPEVPKVSEVPWVPGPRGPWRPKSRSGPKGSRGPIPEAQCSQLPQRGLGFLAHWSARFPWLGVPCFGNSPAIPADQRTALKFNRGRAGTI
jgi:hypothetical protein